MSTIITRIGKGSELTYAELDANFTNLNTDKVELTDLAASGGSALVGYLPAGTGAVATDVQTLLRGMGQRLTVRQFGGIGDGVADDGVALNLALDELRDRIAAVTAIVPRGASVELDLCGEVYRTTISLDATGLSSWGWSIVNGTILGECTGKAVLDTVGSRGGTLRQLVIYGSQSSMPSIGIQAARATAGGVLGYCDEIIQDHVTVFGYYSLSPVYLYGQETSTYLHCRWWNYNYAGYGAILTGSDAIVGGLTSDYLTPITGNTSYINNKYINCDIRYLPAANQYSVTGITKANGPVVSAAGHTFVNGNTVSIGLIQSGMTQINNLVGTVANAVAGVSFELSGVDSTLFSTYTSGGTVTRSQTKPTLFISRAEQHHFDTCYIVNYGSDFIQMHFPDAIDPDQITMDILCEGSGSRSLVRYTPGAGVRTITDFVLRTYNTHCRDSIFSSNISGGATLTFLNVEVSVTGNILSTPTLFDTPANYKLYDADIYYPRSSSFDPADLLAFVGKASFANSLVTSIYNTQLVNPSVSDDSDAATTISTALGTISAAAGTITSASGTLVSKKIGDVVDVSITATITDNGTGSSNVNITLPIAAARVAVLHGRVTGTGKALQCLLLPGNVLAVRLYDNSYPVATGSTIYISGQYQSA